MPRQIPLRRARGDGDAAAEGCAADYLKVIGILLAASIVIGVFQFIEDNFEVCMGMFLLVAGMVFLSFVHSERAQIKIWLVAVEEQIEQWTHEEKRFAVVVAFISILICLILAILGIVVRQNIMR
jgi:hypothetical protein